MPPPPPLSSELYQRCAGRLAVSSTEDQLKVGAELRELILTSWQYWMEDGKKPTPGQLESLSQLVELLGKGKQLWRAENLDLVAQLLVSMPPGTGDPLCNSLKGVAALLLEDHTPTAAARKLLAHAATREEDFGFGHVLYFSLAGLPHTMSILAQRLPTTTTGKPGLVADYQRILLTCQDKDCLTGAFRYLYLGPGTQWAVPSLAALENEKAPVEVWLGVGQAALERPKLQAPLMALLLESPRPFLMPLVAWVWVYGAPSAHNSAEKLLNRWGTMAVLPLLELQVPRPTALIETCKVRPATKSIFSLENAVSPWTATDRLFVCALTVGAPLGNQALESLRNLGTGSTIATVDLLLELVEALESRMSEAAIFDIFLEKCAQTQSLRLMQGLGAVLVRSLGRGGRVSGEQRAILSKRATEVVEGQDSSLALARLALPDSLPFWREQRKKLLPPTWIPEEDQALAFALLPLETQPLQVVYEDATPNQRRLLLGQANFAQSPLAAPCLLQWLSREDPSSLPVFLERLLEQKPEGILDVLAALTGQELPESVRKEAVKAIGERGGRPELMVLGSVEGLDTAPARAAILARLNAAGQDLQGGALEIASAGGDLVVAETSGTSTPSSNSLSPASAPRDPRTRLLPPPRSLSPATLLAYLVLAPNGWGVIWTNVALAVLVLPHSPKRDENLGTLLMALLPFFLNHLLCETHRDLKALRSGVLLAATVDVEAKKSTGKHKITTWYHRLRLLGDDGRLHQITIPDTGRIDALLDEKHEPVLAVLDEKGAPGVVRPLDALRLVEVNNSGFFQLRRRTLGMLALATLPWWPILYDFLT